MLPAWAHKDMKILKGPEALRNLSSSLLKRHHWRRCLEKSVEQRLWIKECGSTFRLMSARHANS